MKIRDIFAQKQGSVSFEFFPPKKPEEEEELMDTVKALKRFSPAFVSVTYGAMGSTQAKTFALAREIKKRLAVETMAHLTCIGSDADTMYQILENLIADHVENVLALRGDIPQDGSTGDFSYAYELVRFIRKNFGSRFCIGVAGYPETHIECKDPEQDLFYLQHKVDCGANFVITQLFFLNDYFFRFVDAARKRGITVPLIPGIMPITNVKQIDIFAQKCGVQVPQNVISFVQAHADDAKALREFGIAYATQQCEELVRNGFTRIHFYTLNRSLSVQRICENLNLKQHFHPPLF